MINDDLSIYFSEFGEDAQINGKIVSVIFDLNYAAMLSDFVEGRAISASLKSSDVQLAEIQHLDLILIRGKSFRVDGIQPTMDGLITDLVLSEA